MGKLRTIPLTGRRPVEIDEDNWPIIAQAEFHGYRGVVISICVREHWHPVDASDGRHIVYGTHPEGWRTYAGQLLAAGEPVEPAIESVGETLGVPDRLVADCIANLPAEQI
jgi:hypothetical protein